MSSLSFKNYFWTLALKKCTKTVTKIFRYWLTLFDFLFFPKVFCRGLQVLVPMSPRGLELSACVLGSGSSTSVLGPFRTLLQDRVFGHHFPVCQYTSKVNEQSILWQVSYKNLHSFLQEQFCKNIETEITLRIRSTSE